MSDVATPTDFRQIKRATFGHGTRENHLHVNSYARDGGIGIETGGDIVQETPSGFAWVYPDADAPPLLADFAQRIDCLSAANDTVTIEACLVPMPELVPEPDPEPTPESLSQYTPKDSGAASTSTWILAALCVAVAALSLRDAYM